MRRLVVVGASSAGMAAAAGAREAGWDGEVVVVGAEVHEPYERPPLSKGLLRAADATLRPLLGAEHIAGLDLQLMLGTRVTTIDPTAREVGLDNGSRLTADGVVLATGARTRPLDIPNARAAGVYELRSASDATLLRDHIDRLASTDEVVIVGAGFIGLEVAAAARERGHPVTVIEAAAAPLLRAGGLELGEWFRKLHEEHGARIRTSAQVDRFEIDARGAVTAVTLAGGQSLPAAMVVVGVGVLPRDELARQAGLIVADGVVVDRTGRSSNPWIYAAGDVANHDLGGVRERVEHWNVAAEQGRAAGRSIAGVETVWDSVPYFWSDQYGLMLQMFGRPRAGDDVFSRETAPDRVLWVWLRAGRVGAVAGVGLPREVRAGRELIKGAVIVDAARLADPAVSLDSLRPPRNHSPATATTRMGSA